MSGAFNPVTPRAILYYFGRGLEVLGLWMTLESILLAGPMGPSPKWAGGGVALFIVGWLLARAKKA